MHHRFLHRDKKLPLTIIDYLGYWGWGGEDDDLYDRVSANGLKINYLSEEIGRYKCLNHEPSETNTERFLQLRCKKSKIVNSRSTFRPVVLKK